MTIMTYKRIILFIAFVTIMSTITVNAAGVEDPITRNLCHFGEVYKEDTNTTVFSAKGHSYGKTVNLSAYGLDGELAYIHPMYYLAKVKSNVVASAADSKGSMVHVKKGETVVIIYMKSHSKKANSICRLTNKRTVFIPNKKLKVLSYLYNSTSAYTDAQVEDWVRQQGFTSATNYMFVISKFNQRGWIMERKKEGWVCKYHLGISSGAYTNGSLPNDCYALNTLAIRTHYKNKKNVGSNGQGISYKSKAGGNQLHTGQAYHPYTHGCVGMHSKDYKFVYYYLPYNTRVIHF